MIKFQILCLILASVLVGYFSHPTIKTIVVQAPAPVPTISLVKPIVSEFSRKITGDNLVIIFKLTHKDGQVTYSGSIPFKLPEQKHLVNKVKEFFIKQIKGEKPGSESFD